MDNLLSGRVALVTGAGRGIGRGIALELARAGCRVAVNYVTEPEKAEETAAEIRALGRDALTVEADISVSSAVAAMIDRVVAVFGGLDIVVNNAATLVRRTFLDLELDDLEAAWEVNLRAPALIMQESFEYLRKAEAPAIVNVVSTAGVNGGIATVSAYGMSKAGLIVLTKAVAREYGPHGIRVFSLSPPSLDSEMQRSLPTEQRERVRSMNVLGRLAPPEEVARFTLLTASGAGSLVTGTMVDLTAIAY
jgi:3-oxoacyl-[acyl-carrier protein] reductase